MTDSQIHDLITSKMSLLILETTPVYCDVYYCLRKKRVLSAFGHFIDDTIITTKTGAGIMTGQVSRFGNCVLNKA